MADDISYVECGTIAITQERIKHISVNLDMIENPSMEHGTKVAASSALGYASGRYKLSLIRLLTRLKRGVAFKRLPCTTGGPVCLDWASGSVAANCVCRASFSFWTLRTWKQQRRGEWMPNGRGRTSPFGFPAWPGRSLNIRTRYVWQWLSGSNLEQQGSNGRWVCEPEQPGSVVTADWNYARAISCVIWWWCV